MFDRRGQAIPLGAKLGTGGEGNVFEVLDHRKLVAKIYHQPLTDEKATKLAHMAEISTPALLQLSAWPTDVLFDRPGGKAVGLLMAKVDGHKPVHLLYGPKSRQKEFPDAQWPFLIHTAANVARAFAAVHEHGHVIGDVNHGNLLVSAEGTVKFIDCDSFQVHAHGRHYLCEVGVSTHTPPELQDISFRTTRRTANHDAFGLAVMVFQLLFMGRHPYSGSYLGKGEMPLEDAIKGGRFAYGPGAASRLMKQPPGTIPLEATGPVAPLFERAFSAVTPLRPTALEWRVGLQALMQGLGQCQANPAHQYLQTLATCPWCTVERQSGFLFFTITAAQATGTVLHLDVSALWQQIKAIRPPQPPPLAAPSSFQAQPSSSAGAVRARARGRQLIGWLVAIAGFIIGLGPADKHGGILIVIAAAFIGWKIGSSDSDGIEKLRAAQRDASRVYEDMRQRWYEATGDVRFSNKLRELECLKAEYDRLPEERRQRLNRLENGRRAKQLEAFLDRFRINAATIPGIGDGRKVTLQSYGIETAADVKRDRILNIPGFGPALTNRIMAWHKTVTARFVFDPNQGVNPAEISKVEADILKRKQEIEMALARGPAELQAIGAQSQAAMVALRQQVEAAARQLAQAEVDLRSVQ
ncbi:protein kinase domain-containing protein [Azospirillum canadense]|uniref:protein kinase domain-containing protein n=1 Tax=Azospirillum canadense TaxID=403962 RepID=UPI0022270781|nr:hypothetical protein [Azospirillum canadense]MCW2242295.1 DNA-binding helix-hairpin-helix protein with protein kinase domain [Azospirillum canadense]